MVLQRKDSFEFYEAKYYQSPMSLSEMKKEEIQIRNIYGLNVSKIGFVSISGFEATPEDYVCINGYELY